MSSFGGMFRFIVLCCLVFCVLSFQIKIKTSRLLGSPAAAGSARGTFSIQVRDQYDPLADGTSWNWRTALTAINTGNIGIGTNSPGYRLDVVGGIRLDAKSALTDAAYFVGSPSYGFRWNSSDDAYNNVVMYDSGNMYVRGSVGIGTTTPQQKLHVQGNIYLGPNNVNNFIHSGAALGLQADGAVNIVSDVNDEAGGGGSDIIFGYGSNTNTDSNQDFTEAELSTYPRVEVMRIQASSNKVGIGTASPEEKLHVQGNLKVTGDVIANNTVKSILLGAGGDQDKFYPIVLSSSRNNPSAIHEFTLTQGSQGGGDPYNFNSLKGFAAGQGWTDMRAHYNVTHARYVDTEKNILGIYRGTASTNDKIFIYVRGGENWYINTDSDVTWYNGSNGTTAGVVEGTTGDNNTDAGPKTANGSDITGQIASFKLGLLLGLQEPCLASFPAAVAVVTPRDCGDINQSAPPLELRR